MGLTHGFTSRGLKLESMGLVLEGSLICGSTEVGLSPRFIGTGLVHGATGAALEY
jgi:hypothetical protein